jgi:hypothetical protein
MTRRTWYDPRTKLDEAYDRIGAARNIAATVEEYGLEETLKAVYKVTGFKVDLRSKA